MPANDTDLRPDQTQHSEGEISVSDADVALIKSLIGPDLSKRRRPKLKPNEDLLMLAISHKAMRQLEISAKIYEMSMREFLEFWSDAIFKEMIKYLEIDEKEKEDLLERWADRFREVIDLPEL